PPAIAQHAGDTCPFRVPVEPVSSRASWAAPGPKRDDQQGQRENGHPDRRSENRALPFPTFLTCPRDLGREAQDPEQGQPISVTEEDKKGDRHEEAGAQRCSTLSSKAKPQGQRQEREPRG